MNQIEQNENLSDLFRDQNTAAITEVIKPDQWQGNSLIFHMSRQMLMEHDMLNTIA